jgi:glycosyltransferase involved in cell wall biosynthesis
MKGLFTSVPRYYVQTRNQQMADLVKEAIGDYDAVLALQPAAGLYVAETDRTTPSVLDELEVSVFREQCSLEPRVGLRLRHALTWAKFRRFARLLTESFNRTTVVSHLELEQLRAIGCDISRIAIVPNGVESTDTPSPAVRTRRVVYPGSVTYSANLDAVRFFVAQILPLVRRVRPDVRLAVTGATGDVDVAELAAAEGVSFTGWVPNVDPLIAESTACVVPLRIGGGTRLKVLQAMALGTPVVSTTKGIEGLDLEPGRHVLVADSPESFASRVIQLIDDPAFGARLAIEARTAVRERYAWEPIVQTLESVIQGAVDDHYAWRSR